MSLKQIKKERERERGGTEGRGKEKSGIPPYTWDWMTMSDIRHIIIASPVSMAHIV